MQFSLNNAGVANLPLEAIEDSNLVTNHSVPLLHKLHRQKYAIRSYDVGADQATPITTIFSLFQVGTINLI
jgi:hypothetical protein